MKTNFKKISTILVVLFSIGTQQVKAQNEKGSYVSISTGYNMGTGNANYYQSAVLGMINSTETSATTSQSEFIKTNLGKGVNAGANFGYMFNKNIGLELGANYLIGGKTKSAQTHSNGDYTKSEVSAKMFQIKPTLVFRGGYDKINPYAKVGLVIGSGKISNTQNEKDGIDIYSRTLELNGGTPIGFHASLGTLYKLNEKISLFGELNLVSLEYAPKKGIYIQYTKNGVDQLPTMTTREKEVEFVDSYTDTGSPSNPNEPNKSFQIPLSFSSFGLNFGVQYHF
ncbi:MAG: outer membrane beta-barrel protein [Flavobacterium sp.]|uniref:outer membrane beta-barrel protein n=1 Tax=Flavobacterium sp. TaxID=239 RepID=UPI0032647BE0